MNTMFKVCTSNIVQLTEKLSYSTTQIERPAAGVAWAKQPTLCLTVHFGSPGHVVTQFEIFLNVC